jgi:hypothetical protein
MRLGLANSALKLNLPIYDYFKNWAEEKKKEQKPHTQKNWPEFAGKWMERGPC